MNEGYHRIILATDALQASAAATATALNLAKAHHAKVTVVDTLRPPSKTARWFHSNSEDVFQMVLADKQERIEKVAIQFREEGVDAESKVLIGKSSEEITREAIEGQADLVIRYRKGVSSRYPGAFGNTARNLMRVCPCPLLLVGDEPLEHPKVLACVNAEHDEPENATILTETQRLATDKQHCTALYCWNLYGDDYLKYHLADSAYQRTMQESEQIYKGVYQRFIDHHNLECFENGLRIEHGDPTTVIPKFCRDESIDVVVMSSASLNHPVLRMLGSTIELILDELPCAILVVKPEGFESPIKASVKNEKSSS